MTELQEKQEYMSEFLNEDSDEYRKAAIRVFNAKLYSGMQGYELIFDDCCNLIVTKITKVPRHFLGKAIDYDYALPPCYKIIPLSCQSLIFMFQSTCEGPHNQRLRLLGYDMQGVKYCTAFRPVPHVPHEIKLMDIFYRFKVVNRSLMFKRASVTVYLEGKYQNKIEKTYNVRCNHWITFSEKQLVMSSNLKMTIELNENEEDFELYIEGALFNKHARSSLLQSEINYVNDHGFRRSNQRDYIE